APRPPRRRYVGRGDDRRGTCADSSRPRAGKDREPGHRLRSSARAAERAHDRIGRHRADASAHSQVCATSGELVQTVPGHRVARWPGAFLGYYTGPMTTLEFAKGHGTGNDFVLFSDPEGDIRLSPDRIRRLCDRRFGIGADGLIRAVRSRALPEGHAVLEAEPEAEWFMDYWNADGTPAEMCGNGARVYAHYLAS